MRLLHTADWHVGKALRGRSRIEEHRAVLAEIVDHARGNDVDVTVVAGDLFESSAPPPEAEAVVYRALRALGEVAPVLVVAGNHDAPGRLRAVAPLLDLGRVTVVAEPTRPDQGGVVELTTDAGESAVVAMLPFVSQRGIVRADELMAGTAAEAVQRYADRLRRLAAVLCEPFRSDSVNLVVAHCFVADGVLGGGERSAHTVLDYWVPGVAFPPTASYVALGHLHRPQQLPGATAIHYSGSPLQLDFGEVGDQTQVNLVDAQAGRPARVEPLPLTAGRPLKVLTGTLEQVIADAEQAGDAWLRAVVTEARRAGLADHARARIGERLVDVVIEAPGGDREPGHPPRRSGRTPRELFDAFCAERGVDDPRVARLFDELLDEVQSEARA
ncbi:MAG: exonuclease SbcCD subunit D [Acidimicrobiales bacterium]|nr:exonuclease SbcCD subunit D [Acidimicrobiales bacterium]